MFSFNLKSYIILLKDINASIQIFLIPHID